MSADPTVMFPDRLKAADDLLGFAKANEPRLYKLLGACFDPQSDLRTLVKSQVSAEYRERRQFTELACRLERAAATSGANKPFHTGYNLGSPATIHPVGLQPVIRADISQSTSERRWP